MQEVQCECVVAQTTICCHFATTSITVQWLFEGADSSVSARSSAWGIDKNMIDSSRGALEERAPFLFCGMNSNAWHAS
jgi:hypothetical protein